MPNQLLQRKCKADFGVIFLGRKPQTSTIPTIQYNHTVLYCMMCHYKARHGSYMYYKIPLMFTKYKMMFTSKLQKPNRLLCM